MKRSGILLGLIAAVAFTTASEASVIVTTGSTTGQTSDFAATTYDFNSAGTSAPGFQVVSAPPFSVDGQYAQPFGDTTAYATVGSDPDTGNKVLSFSTPTNYIGLLWGSIDTYNNIRLTTTDGVF